MNAAGRPAGIKRDVCTHNAAGHIAERHPAEVACSVAGCFLSDRTNMNCE